MASFCFVHNFCKKCVEYSVIIVSALGSEICKKDSMNVKKIYIILSQTDTVLARTLKLVTGAEYNHASIGLDESMNEIYSFGRLHPKNPFVGGFVRESKNGGTFKRFYKTRAVILRTEISDEDYRSIQGYFRSMYAHRREYCYNYKGLFLAFFGKAYRNERHFYCSEFVRHILIKFQIESSESFHDIIKPIDFLALKNWEIVYQGDFQSYPVRAPQKGLAL